MLILASYYIHKDAVKHSSDKFISLSQAWEDVKTNKFMKVSINACNGTGQFDKSK